MYAIHVTAEGQDCWLNENGLPGSPREAKLFEVASEALNWAYDVAKAVKGSNQRAFEMRLTPCIVLTAMTPKGKWEGFVTTSRVRAGDNVRIFPSTEIWNAGRVAVRDVRKAAKWGPDQIQEALMDEWARVAGLPNAHLFCVVFCNRGMNL